MWPSAARSRTSVPLEADDARRSLNTVMRGSMSAAASGVAGTILLLLALTMPVGSADKLKPHPDRKSDTMSSYSEADVDNDSNSRASDEVRLLRHLLSRYATMGKIARPTYNSSTATPVWFGLRLIQLEMDERDQLMRSSVWVRYRWIDEYLRWDPAKFGGLELITLPWDKVWVPDIVLVNTASTSVAERPADIMVSHEGGVFWSPHRMYKSGCLIDISNFPFDWHICDLWFQSMSHFTWHLDLHPYHRNPWDLQTYLASFKESQGWEIISNSTERFDSSRKPSLVLKFSKRVALLFSLTVKRRPGYTCHLLMLPCVFLGALTLVVFCLPAERPDRITLAMSLFASFLVLLLILVEAAPPSAASVPQLGVYYACNMVLIMTSVFLSASVVNISRRGERKLPVPKLLRFVFIEVLSRPLLLHGLIVRIVPQKKVSTNWRDTEGNYAPSADHTDNYLSTTRPGDFCMPYGKEDRDDHDNDDESQVAKCLIHIDERLQRLEYTLARPALGRQMNIEQFRMSQEWKMVALVMDRLYFVVYIVALVLSSVIFFPRPKPT